MTWLACDALAAAGRKPSIASVREWTLANQGRKQGSDTDTQADINAWYALLLAMRQEKQTVAGLPEEVAALARGLWIKANEAASDSLQAHRETIDDALAAARRATADAVADALTARHEAAQTGHALDVAHESIRRLEEALSALRATVEATEVRHAGQLQAKDERIAALTRDIARKESEHAARLVEFDGLRKHALMQIDEARTESRYWKSECERTAQQHQTSLAAERQNTATAQAELAGASGRLSAIEEALAAAQSRAAQLENELAQSRLATATTATTGIPRGASARRTASSAVPRPSPFRRRKL